MSLLEKDFWYIACEEKNLKKKKILSATILGEKLVLFITSQNKIVALQDRCLHRSSPLSCGLVINDSIQCPYHGWTYDQNGKVSFIPSEGAEAKLGNRRIPKYQVQCAEGYVYVCLTNKNNFKPYKIPHFDDKKYQHIRLINYFDNNVTNCVENFVDVPHTTFVHPTIFRNESHNKIKALVKQSNGEVHVEYKGEKSDLGIFNFFLNPEKKEFKHTDEFLMPNITRVQYWLGDKKHFVISSQSVPVENNKTIVYTDLTYNYGIWNKISKPIIKVQAQKIIDQDVDILNKQSKIIKKYGTKFQNSPCDIIHTYIEDIRNEINNQRDPRALPEKYSEVEIWI